VIFFDLLFESIQSLYLPESKVPLRDNRACEG
jgi:hypothetical protein